jgi:hypothetical protein
MYLFERGSGGEYPVIAEQIKPINNTLAPV